jgi:glycosyltransferase involved in cell wall biosynthesis
MTATASTASKTLPSAPPAAWLACMGDATDPVTYSSTPYHLLDEGVRQGVLAGGLRLHPNTPTFRRRRIAWNLGRVLTGHRHGGYQYAPRFLDQVWAPSLPTVAGGTVVNLFQLYPPSLLNDRSVRRWSYIDGTMRQLIDHYGERLDPGWAADLIAREREGYHSAEGVIGFAGFAARSVVADYGVDPARVHFVVPGANITRDEFDKVMAAATTGPGAWRDPQTGRRRVAAAADEPLRLVFVGRTVVRKGLDRLIRAIALGRRQGLRATLRVIGLAAADAPPELRDVPGVEWVGLVSRRTDPDRLFRLIAECDVGCLLSRAEFSAMSLREYLALGLAVLGTSAGGCSDLMLPAASWSVAPEDPDERVAEILLSAERDPDQFERRRQAAWAAREGALWADSVSRLGRIMRGGLGT